MSLAVLRDAVELTLYLKESTELTMVFSEVGVLILYPRRLVSLSTTREADELTLVSTEAGELTLASSGW